MAVSPRKKAAKVPADPVETRHPSYAAHIVEWETMRDTSQGEVRVKDRGVIYLPMPSGFAAQPDSGAAMYASYMKRAQFPEIVQSTISGMVGVIHRTESKIEMPEALQPLWESATPDGLTLEALHRRITSELLLCGRYSLMVDAPAQDDPRRQGRDLPWIVGYEAEDLTNWADDRSMFVFNETGPVLEGFVWRDRAQYRVLDFLEGRYRVRLWTAGVWGKEILPTARGEAAMEEIPVVVAGARDLSLEPETPPVIGVARSAIAIYQISADYRWQLFMTGQETLFVINADAPSAVGAGVTVAMKGAPDLTPDAKYVGPSGTGIEAHRQAIQDEKDAAARAGARLLDSDTQAAESGDARRIRYAAQTATLILVSICSAQALEQALKHLARMVGQSEDDIVVTPDLSFIDSALSPTEAQALVSMWKDGAISYETLYENLQRGEIASAERTAEEELDQMDEEDLITAPPLDPGQSGIVTDPTRGAGGQRQLPAPPPASSN